ncbi:Mid2-like cell wall stress sensor domain protein [Staphylococcus sp. 18_1_E_LY]|uniref:Mid2-like cell wall stress sensor domain protein n=1 Tax=Staphylococcus lloydii TaxID=2781774 RepID=A0A7T1AY06_9STAP|nr:Mid2-like cell wall stress sensor domain protein [Staphylococcus lloydii]MBF7018717.1 Mid2-like cell wall stress sensor domain protein [Staphylococcus lloydii]MBF7026445.1 Mid2-like cell wall stress sensor domain protein [Staphylococcus lloydii]MDU9417666.1 Mid2-like cell wall stress sensor domain protein [Staphylococcus lloydii]QPM74118.1 Mid2-like cell wall stress sensor domain protein [Staphylococcus lloydii]
MGFWILFGITVLIAVYSLIVLLTASPNKSQKRTNDANKASNKKVYGIIFVVFLVIAIIEIIVFANS